MFQVFLILLFIGASIALFVKAKYAKDKPILETMTNGDVELNLNSKRLFRAYGAILLILAINIFANLSFVWVAKDEIYLMDCVYCADSMETGQIIATREQKGPQAETIPPGFHVIPFVGFFYDLEPAPIHEVPVGMYGLVQAKDGKPLREGQVIADGWENYADMIDAEKFLSKGQKGTQLTVLPPGQYRINTYLFSVINKRATQVKTGEVAVIRSNVQTTENCNHTILDEEGLTTALVSKGCVGVWDKPLSQGMYYLNDVAYIPTHISTRAQVWAYKGGYTTKKINLTVNDDGSISQQDEPIKAEVPENAADKAINVRVEGWTVPVEMRVTVQVAPKDAPRVVAGVGSLQNVEDKITTPNVRDSLRTIGGRSPSGCTDPKDVTTCKDSGARVLDFVNKRAEISNKVFEAIKPATQNAGVTILDVNMGEPAIPPELLIADQREQLATQLKQTYITEQRAQKERIKSEREKATADQQGTLVKAEIGRKASLEAMHTRENQGIGERKYLQELAKGEKARKDVLGEENVVKLKALEIIAANPQLVKVPENLTVVGDSASGLGELGALLGRHSNIAKSIPTVTSK